MNKNLTQRIKMRAVRLLLAAMLSGVASTSFAANAFTFVESGACPAGSPNASLFWGVYPVAIYQDAVAGTCSGTSTSYVNNKSALYRVTSGTDTVTNPASNNVFAALSLYQMIWSVLAVNHSATMPSAITSIKLSMVLKDPSYFNPSTVLCRNCTSTPTTFSNVYGTLLSNLAPFETTANGASYPGDKCLVVICNDISRTCSIGSVAAPSVLFFNKHRQC